MKQMVKGNITRCSVCDDERSFALTIDYTTISDCNIGAENDEPISFDFVVK